MIDAVSVYRFSPLEEMTKEAKIQLEQVITENKKGNLSDGAVIRYLYELAFSCYNLKDWQSEDVPEAYNDLLNTLHQKTQSQQLIGLVNNLFSEYES